MPIAQWTKPEVHEALAALYLRLNGYFTTGLILHSPEWGKNLTEIDCLAVRHPNHSQPERGLDCADFLAIPKDEIDLLLCEVKSVTEQVMFNKPPRENLEVLQALLRWAGIFSESEVRSVAQRLQPLLQDGVNAATVRDGVVEGRCRVRPFLCCPPCSEDGCADRWCLTGAEIFNFVNRCFNPEVNRDSCSTRYNFQQWGYALLPLIEYFKNVEDGDIPKHRRSVHRSWCHLSRRKHRRSVDDPGDMYSIGRRKHLRTGRSVPEKSPFRRTDRNRAPQSRPAEEP